MVIYMSISKDFFISKSERSARTLMLSTVPTELKIPPFVPTNRSVDYFPLFRQVKTHMYGQKQGKALNRHGLLAMQVSSFQWYRQNNISSGNLSPCHSAISPRVS